MKYSDFLNYINKNKKQQIQYSNISDEFITNGYEDFLLISYTEYIENQKLVESALKEYSNKSNPKVNSMLMPLLDILNIKRPNSYGLLFRYSPSKAYYLACEVSLKAEEHIVLPNLFQDDTSKNHLVFFGREQIKELALMDKIISPYSLDPGISGYSIYNLGIEYITNLCAYENKPICFPKPDILTHYMGKITRKDNDPLIIKQTREIISEVMGKNVFVSELELSVSLRNEIMIKMQDLYDQTSAKLRQISKSKAFSKKEINDEKESVFNKLIKEKRIPVKWKSERKMFELIFESYNDAIFQYKPDWLAPQTYDVIVPSIKTAFEYQGIQHYKTINFFGGEEALKKRIMLDERKKQLSNQYGINLVEWHYEDTITKTTLIQKLKALAIEI
jgi:hypothetical protein